MITIVYLEEIMDLIRKQNPNADVWYDSDREEIIVKQELRI